MSAVLLGATVFLGACQENALDVTNLNSPDVSRSYATPGNVEILGSSVFKNMFNGQYGSLESMWPQTMTMSLESHSSLGNAGMGTRATIPRAPISNTIGNTTATGNFRDFNTLARNGRTAANVVAAIDRYRAETPPRTSGSAQQDYRNKGFAFFNVGYALGHLSLLYDSAAIVIPATPSDVIPPFSAAKDVNVVALQQLDSAILYANLATGQTIPNSSTGWVSGPAASTIAMPRFVQIIYSFKARLRAGIARTPTERAAVDWAAVINEATAGIQSDFIVYADATSGWSTATLATYRQEASWSQMTPFILGMGDTSRAGDPQGSYRDWITKTLSAKTPFLMRTPDNRFPSGETRALQNTASGGTSKAGPPASNPRLYFRNRVQGDDRTGETWGTWYYDNHRFWGIANNSNNGPFVVLSRAENDMLAAEGYLRTNQFGAATLLIDRYRVASNLPPVTGIADLTTPVPGGTACVPNVPVPPTYTTTACGNLFEAMKWEKRMETSFTGYAQWFLDARGWGDLVENTALEWPVPYDELFARGILTTYTTSAKSAKGTYGF
jgi:hypothetical protein